jgi:hypothetical protein
MEPIIQIKIRKTTKEAEIMRPARCELSFILCNKCADYFLLGNNLTLTEPGEGGEWVCGRERGDLNKWKIEFTLCEECAKMQNERKQAKSQESSTTSTISTKTASAASSTLIHNYQARVG